MKSILLVGVLLVVLTIVSSTAIKNPAPIHYVKNIPGTIMAMTVPPFGIFIEKQYQEEGDLPGTILAHERIHWLQYQERGLIGFYYKYLTGLIQHGRLYNDLEKDARDRSK